MPDPERTSLVQRLRRLDIDHTDWTLMLDVGEKGRRPRRSQGEDGRGSSSSSAIWLLIDMGALCFGVQTPMSCSSPLRAISAARHPRRVTWRATEWTAWCNGFSSGSPFPSSTWHPSRVS